MKTLLVILPLLAACGDDRVPADPPADAPAVDLVRTWGDAWEVWAEAWCRLAARCEPELFENYYPGGHGDCVISVAFENCLYSQPTCDTPYEPERLDALARCESDMDMLACGVTMAPLSCYEAFW